MFQHVVFLRLRDPIDVEEAARRLRRLAEQVPSLRELQVGIDVIRSARSWDLVLQTTFDDQQGMEAYQVHPAHVQVLIWLREHVLESATVDYVVES